MGPELRMALGDLLERGLDRLGDRDARVLGVRGRAAPPRRALELGEQRLALGRQEAEPAQVGVPLRLGLLLASAQALVVRARARASIGAPASPSPETTASDGSPSGWRGERVGLPIPTRSLAWNSRPGSRRSVAR
jgi:hypothetical protein